MARNRQKLEGVVIELKAAFPKLETRIIVADFKQSFESGFYDKIAAEVEGLDVSILVNNVGVERVGEFDKLHYREVKQMAVINLLPQVLLSHKLIKKMQERPGYYRSAIINVSSMDSLHPTKGHSGSCCE